MIPTEPAGWAADQFDVVFHPDCPPNKLFLFARDPFTRSPFGDTVRVMDDDRNVQTDPTDRAEPGVSPVSEEQYIAAQLDSVRMRALRAVGADRVCWEDLITLGLEGLQLEQRGEREFLNSIMGEQQTSVQEAYARLHRVEEALRPPRTTMSNEERRERVARATTLDPHSSVLDSEVAKASGLLRDYEKGRNR